MKKIYLSLSLLLLSFIGFSQNQTYSGNGNTGFGDDIGTGNLNVVYDGTNLTFTMTKGAGNFNDVLVLYIDNGTGGGFSTTAGFNDVSSGIAAAISGRHPGSPNDSSILNFPSGFAPQYALAFGPNGNTPPALLVNLANGSTLQQLETPALSNDGNTSASTYVVSILASDLGFTTSSFSFHFIGTIISNSGYRSNEGLGINIPNPIPGIPVSTLPNIGWNAYTDTTETTLLFSSANLPLSLGNFTGLAKGNTINLNWNTKSEINLSQFNVQKSVDGVKWNTIGNVSAKNIITGSSYAFDDNNATASRNYYRLQSLNKDASFTYSTVLLINKNGGHHIVVLGNPATNAVNLNISDDNAKAYTLSLYSSDGKLLTSQQFNSSIGTSKASVNIPSGAKGMCILKVTSTEGSESFRVMVQ